MKKKSKRINEQQKLKNDKEVLKSDINMVDECMINFKKRK
jgi:hypothetical protein